MAHITLPDGLPGIRGPLSFSPETTRPLTELVQVLLAGPHSLTPAEREMIATYVSSRTIATTASLPTVLRRHSISAAADYQLIADVKADFESAPLSGKMKALLNVAGKVQEGGKQVTTADVERARREGATDREIHDTVLIAAAFCMFNRYVDGLATWQPQDPAMYIEIGQQTARLGYSGRDYRKPLESLTPSHSE